MARSRKQRQPLYWTDVTDKDGGKVLGRYAVEDGIIIVQSAKGWEKRTHASHGGSNDGLAFLILSEGPPP